MMLRPRFRRPAVSLLLLVSSLLLPGCDDFERNAYRTLKVAQVEYELLQDHAARAYVAGRLSDDQWDRFALAGHRFIAAHTLAADLMKTYQQSRRAGSSAEENQRLQAQVNAALAQLPALLADLRDLLISFDTPAPRSEAKPNEDPVEDPERSRRERSRRERRSPQAAGVILPASWLFVAPAFVAPASCRQSFCSAGILPADWAKAQAGWKPALPNRL